MGVACQILLTKTKEGVYKAGQNVSGVVKYAIDKPTEYKAITLSLLGTGKCSWTEHRSKSRYKTYYGSEKYVTNHIHIINKVTIVGFGSHEYPFEFHLPDDLPSSFQNDICTIKYKIELEFEKPSFFSFNKKFNREIPVYGFIKPSVEGPIIVGLEKTLFKLFTAEKPVIKLKAELPKTYVSPGENAQLSLVVTNDTDVIPSVKAELFCHTVYTADCGKTKESVERVKDCIAQSPEIPERGVATLSLAVPTRPELYTINAIVMKKEYKVCITLRVPMPHFNTSVEMGLAIGEMMENQDPAFEMDAEPPSYWEAMREDKQKEVTLSQMERPVA